MALSYSESIVSGQLRLIMEAADAGNAGAKLLILGGSRPKSGGDLTTILATLTMSDEAFSVVSSGAIKANKIEPDKSASNSGAATWFRITDSDGSFVMDGDIGGDIDIKPTRSIVKTANVAMNSFIISAS